MRADLLNGFYVRLAQLAERQEGYQTLNQPIPIQFLNAGVYFFFDEEATRTGTQALKVMRVGKSSIKTRLRTHRGNIGNGGGNHRGSIFRKHVGGALIQSFQLHAQYPTWGLGNTAPRAIRLQEHSHEQETSTCIRRYPFLYLPLQDPDLRSFFEECSIELLSNRDQPVAIDVPPAGWLGYHCPNPCVVSAHLWNDHYTCNYQPNNPARYETFLFLLQDAIENYHA